MNNHLYCSFDWCTKWVVFKNNHMKISDFILKTNFQCILRYELLDPNSCSSHFFFSTKFLLSFHSTFEMLIFIYVCATANIDSLNLWEHSFRFTESSWNHFINVKKISQIYSAHTRTRICLWNYFMYSFSSNSFKIFIIKTSSVVSSKIEPLVAVDLDMIQI